MTTPRTGPPQTDCRHFTGYKPCGLHDACDARCPRKDVARTRVLVVHLEALGAVLRSTALLPAIRRKFPSAHVTWVTQRPADAFLRGCPFVDRVLTADSSLELSALEFDVAFALDKSLKAAGVLMQARSIDFIYGFVADPRTGAIVPATPAAQELWEIGLDDRRKFFENRKPETQLACEALELGPWRRDEYVVRLTDLEARAARERRAELARGAEWIVGLNTGCSAVMPNKKLSVRALRELAARLAREPGARVVLLGGSEDRERNERVAYGLDVAQTPVDRGVRDGLVSVEACDAVITGDSLGMHMAIGLRKWTVAWFGPTCEQEIDLYGRGRKILSGAECAPCWKRRCERNPMCYDLVSVDSLAAAALEGRGLQTCHPQIPLESAI